MQDPSTWRLQTTVGGIPLKHVSRTGGLGPNSAECTDVFIIQANRLSDFASECFPIPYAGSGTVIYPRGAFLPGFPALTVQHMDFESFTSDKPIDPFGGDPSAPSGTYSDYVKVTVKYGTNPANDTEADPSNPFTFLEVSANYSGTFLSETVIGDGFWDVPTPQLNAEGKIINAITRPDIPKTVIENTVEWNIRWPQIPFDYFDQTIVARIRARIGMVNDAVMTLFDDAPIHTMLFLGFSLSENHTWREGYAGRSPITLDMKFVEKNFKHGEGILEVQVTHNHFYDKQYGIYRKLYVNEALMYTTTNLQAIWEG